jgi:hypothetical protein
VRPSSNDRWLLVSLIAFAVCAALLATLFAYQWAVRPRTLPSGHAPRTGANSRAYTVIEPLQMRRL